MLDIIVSFSNIFLTIMIVVFACLQWKAVDKQNKQNLFVLRINLYKELNGLIWNILFCFMNIKENINNKQNVSNITVHSLEINHKLLEIKQLFNSDICNIVDAFVNECTINASHIKEETDGAKSDFIGVFEKSDKIKDAFEQFFNDNKI